MFKNPKFYTSTLYFIPPPLPPDPRWTALHLLPPVPYISSNVLILNSMMVFATLTSLTYFVSCQ